MNISDYRKKSPDIRNRLTELKTQRAAAAIAQLKNSEQYRIAVAMHGGTEEAEKLICSAAANAVADPTSEFLDVLRARGYRKAEIRKEVHLLFARLLDVENKHEEKTYEEMLTEVAEYVAMHQEVYADLTPERLRNQQ